MEKSITSKKLFLIVLLCFNLKLLAIGSKVIVFNNNSNENVNLLLQAYKLDKWDDLHDNNVGKKSTKTIKMVSPKNPTYFIVKLYLELSNSESKIVRFTNFIEDTIRINYNSQDIDSIEFDNEVKERVFEYEKESAKILNNHLKLQFQLSDSISINDIQIEDSLKLLMNRQNTVDNNYFYSGSSSYFLLAYIYSNFDSLIKLDELVLKKSIKTLNRKYKSYNEFKVVSNLISQKSQKISISKIALVNNSYKKELISCSNSDSLYLFYFWTSGCPPCYNDFRNYSSSKKLDSFNRYTIYVGNDFNKWLDELSRKKFNWKNLAELNYWHSQFKRKFKIKQYPTTIVYNCKKDTYRSFNSLRDIY